MRVRLLLGCSEDVMKAFLMSLRFRARVSSSGSGISDSGPALMLRC